LMLSLYEISASLANNNERSGKLDFVIDNVVPSNVCNIYKQFALNTVTG